jgi:large subunit ribosomal protein L16
LLLQPRKFKYKSSHKNRRLNGKMKARHKMLFGQIGLRICQPTRLNSKNIFRLKLFLNKAVRRGEETRRKVWLNAFPHWPLTKKHIGSRMGKGTGKLKTWFSKLNTAHTLIELKNLRLGRSLFFLKQVQHRLKCYSKIVWKSSNPTRKVTSLKKTSVFYQSFW